MTFFVVIYVLIATLSVVAILRFNTVGFMVVLLMSAVHFGIGDAAFINELDRRTSVTNKLPRFFYAAAGGSAPVLIPLVNSASTDALSQVNPSLVNWHQGFDQQILIGVTFLSIASIVVLILGKRQRDAIDIGLLLVLALVTPPLIAFAVYFGCWHAMRHTARLTLSLDSSQRAYAANNLSKAFSRAVLPGVPALVGTFVIAGLLSLAETNFTDNFLWMSLVVVWALTVPHMMVTARLDRAALA
jgi:Brp/Blh family beta-carotene 15,15'-monooxygenase